VESQSGSTVEMGLGRVSYLGEAGLRLGPGSGSPRVRLRKRLGLAAPGKTRFTWPAAVHLYHLAKVRILWPGGVGAPVVVRLEFSHDAPG
jgi:hypothetical protein